MGMEELPPGAQSDLDGSLRQTTSVESHHWRARQRGGRPQEPGIYVALRREDESGGDDAAAWTGFRWVLPSPSRRGVFDLSTKVRRSFFRGIEGGHLPWRVV